MAKESTEKTRLVLTRRRGQSLLLEGGIRIVVGKIDAARHAVRFVIEAPPTVRVVREELLDVEGGEDWRKWWQDTGGEGGGA